MDEIENFFCQFPNPWSLRVSGMVCYTSKCEKKSKSLHPSIHVWGSGPPTDKYLPQRLLQVNCSRWRYFALPSMSNLTKLIIVRPRAYSVRAKNYRSQQLRVHLMLNNHFFVILSIENDIYYSKLPTKNYICILQVYTLNAHCTYTVCKFFLFFLMYLRQYFSWLLRKWQTTCMGLKFCKHSNLALGV